MSVVVPVYNEEESLPTLVSRLSQVLVAIDDAYEIITVDDGSRDRSFAILRELAAQNPHLRVVRLRRNFGQTAAFAAGFDRARGDVVLTIDADLQNDPADIPRLVERIGEGYDVVSGWRVKRRDPFMSRRLPSIIANRMISILTGVALHDYGCSLKAYRREVLVDLPLYGELHRFIPAIASWQGIAVTEMPVNHQARQFGKSKYGIGRTTRVLLDVVTVRFMLNYATRPMQIFGLFGLIFGAIGAALLVYLGSIRLVLHQPIADRPLLLLGVLLSIMAIQLFGIGLLGEMIVRTAGTGQRVAYRVREEVNAPVQTSTQSQLLDVS